jgi:hypothetical protein
MIKTALGTLALACIAVAAPLQDCSLDPRVASEWTSAVVGILAANAHGYGPGYYFSPGYALSRGPDIAALAMVLRAPAGSFAAAGATDSTIAEARWLDDRSQSGSY